MLFAIQSNSVDAATNNVRLMKSSSDTDPNDSLCNGTPYEYVVIQPKDIGLLHWQENWNDDVGYLNDFDLQQFALDVAVVQGFSAEELLDHMVEAQDTQDQDERERNFNAGEWDIQVGTKQRCETKELK